MALVLA
jgi:hypothetical protein